MHSIATILSLIESDARKYDHLKDEKIEWNFIFKCRQGLIKDPLNEIDDYVERWHDDLTIPDVSLHEYLGMSWNEYSEWIKDPSTLLDIIKPHICLFQDDES